MTVRPATPAEATTAPRTAVAFVPSAPLASPGPNATGPVHFPAEFRWGSATAAYQVEGAAAEGGRGESIWDVFCRVPGAVHNGDDGAVACDHYHRYQEDVALMRDLNLDTYRFSTSWARVMPDGRTVNPAGLDFYSRLVDELLGAGVAPWLTLYHWDLPQALEDAGGWPSRETAYRFADYAAAMHDALGDRVDVWTTLNEPWCSAFLGYTGGEHAPGRRSPVDGVAAAHHLLLGHGLALDALRSRAPEATLGITLNFTVADPADPADPADLEAARKEDGIFNRMFVEPIMRGVYPPDIVEDIAHLGFADHICEGDLDLISAPIDVLGVNYYNGGAVAGTPEQNLEDGFGRPDGVREETAEPVRQTRSPNPLPDIHPRSRGLPRTDMGWEVQPEGLTRLLTRLQRDYTGPRGTALVVTENGAAYPDVVGPDGQIEDTDRLHYIDQHLRAVKDAMDAGADVRGYLVWSLMDNFEWALGYSKRFGVVRVDYETQQRTVKASGSWYAQVAASGTVPGEH